MASLLTCEMVVEDASGISSFNNLCVNSLPTVTPFSRPIATPAERIDLSR